MSYIDTEIAGYDLTYNPESLVWNTPNDIVEQRLTGRGKSTAFFGGPFMDMITFDGWVNDTDLVQLLTFRDYNRIVTLKGDMVARKYPTSSTVYCLIEEISFNEQAGFTTATSRLYPYKFRLRKVGDADHYKRATICQTSYIYHNFSFTPKPVVGLPSNCTSLSQSKFDTYTKLLLHLDGVAGSTTILDSSFSAHALTANGNAQICAATNYGLTSTGVSTYDGYHISAYDGFSYGVAHIFNGGVIAIRVTLPAGAITSIDGHFGYYAYGETVRVALYSDNGSGTAPSSLLVESGATTIPFGGPTSWTKIPITYTVPSAGYYWIAANHSDQENGSLTNLTTGGVTSYYAKAYGAMDASWSGGATPGTHQIGVRVTMGGIGCDYETWNHAQIDTAQFKFGPSSLLLDGTDDYLSASASSAFNYGTGDFTVDFWVRFNSLTNAMILCGQYVDASNYWKMLKDTAAGGNKLSMTFVIGGVAKGNVVMTNPWAGAATGTWYHLAFVRNGSNAYIFIGGVPQALTTTTSFSTNDVGVVVGHLMVGQLNSTNYLNGWIDEFRISKATARWTADFSASLPTSRYSRDSYTSSLLHFDATDATTTMRDDTVTGICQASQLILASLVPVQSISFYSSTSGNARFAVYSDSSGPNTKLWESGDTSIIVGWNTVNMSAGTPTILALSPATYWLAWQWNPGTTYFDGPALLPSAAASGGNYIFQAYNTFPATWSGGTSSNSNFSEYITSIAGKFNQSIVLDGSGDFVSSLDDADWFFSTGDFTIDFWVMFLALPSAGQDMVIVGQYVDGSNYWNINLYNDSGTYYWTLYHLTGGVATINFGRSTAMVAGIWYHIALVRSGTNFYFFKDGTQIGSTLVDADPMTDMASPLYIGQAGYSGEYFNGLIDELKISKGIARWIANFTPESSAYIFPYRTGEDGPIPIIPNFKGNKLYYDIAEANLEDNNVEILRSNDEVGLKNGIVWIQSRGNELTNTGNLDIYCYTRSDGWLLIGQVEFLVYDSSWVSMKDQYLSIESMVEDDSEYSSLYGVWEATSNDVSILCEIELARGKPYFGVRVTNAGTTPIKGMCVRINIDAAWADQFRYWVHGATTEDATSGAHGTPDTVSGTADDHAHCYLMTTATIAFNTMYAGVINRTRANGRTYAANDQGSSWSYVDVRFNGTSMTQVTTGNDLEQFWICLKEYESLDDDPAELAKECTAPVDQSQDLVRVS